VWNFLTLLHKPSKLPARVRGRNYLHFLQTHLTGLLKDVSFNTRRHMVSTRRSSTTLLSLHADVNFQSLGLHAHLTWIHSIFPVRIFENQALLPVQSILGRNCGVEFNNLPLK
jgi:hypothetical protein